MVDERALRRLIGDQRLSAYREQRTFNFALRQYEWNIALSAAVYESLHRVEVTLRNALDRELALWNQCQSGPGPFATHGHEWLVTPAPLLRRLLGSSWEKARARVARRSRVSSADDERMHTEILAQLPFSAWRFLLPDQDPGRRFLWSHATHRAFPGWDEDPRVLTRTVAGLVNVRNRVAHLEPIIRPGYVERKFTAMRRVVGAIDPAAEMWLVSRQRVTAVLGQRPRESVPPVGLEEQVQP